MPDDQDNKQAGTLDEALTRLVNAYVRGAQPDVDEFVAQYPQHEAQIRQRVVSLREVDSLFDSLAQADASDFEEAAPERDLAGQRVGNFEVVERIGRGGMGVVYLAHDTKLKRSVALKSMPARLANDATARMRFRREGELLASLNHPNIAVIHDIVEEEPGYFVLEYVPGETLAERSARGPLAPEQVLSIGRQIAEAIAAAHEKGVIHRDLKPGNIKLTPEGRVKVLDFGLARLVGPEGESQETTVTQGGRIAGTPAYMSPEQARGKPVDHRTDIWSFGCILYQMLTGRLPFEGETATDTLAHIIEREPDWEALPPGTPANLRALLHRCLEKDLEKRLGDITEAAAAMNEASTAGVTRPVTARAKARRIALAMGAVTLVALGLVAVRFALQGPAPSSPEETRLVVLPFKNLGPAEEQWRADGITDEIQTRLGPIRNLAIIGSYSASQYKDKGTNPRQIGKELDVDYILEGSVQSERSPQANALVRMRVRLVRASDAAQIWAESYDDDMSNVLRRQSDIAEKVAQALDITLLEPERQALTYGYIDNAEAFACFRQGHEDLTRVGGREGNAKAIEMFEKAIALEPNYAEAHASLSNALTNMYWVHGRKQGLLPRAKEAAERAIQLAPDLPAGHVVLARYYYQGCYDYENALKEYSIALRSHPNHVHALAWMGFTQRRMGRFEEALPNLLRAAELDPLDRRYPDSIGHTLVLLEKYEEADRYYEQAIRMDPDAAGPYCRKAELYVIWQGDTQKARDTLDRALRANKELASDPYIFDVLFYADICDRDFEAAIERLVQRSEDFDNMSWYIPNDLRLAEVYGYVGREDLERAHYQLAADTLEKRLAEDPDYPGIHRVHSSLGRAYAGLGRAQEAIYEGLRGVECLPITKDAMNGTLRLEDLARIYVMVGKYEDAIDILEQLLSRPSELSVARLRLDPVWEPLGKHPRFQRLLAPGS
jgi:TolB-like protein/Tfp pilus assembly protein PilF